MKRLVRSQLSYLIVLSAIGAGLLPVAGCEGAKAQPDQRLGGLVHSARDEAPTINVDKAARDPRELGRAIQIAHHHVSSILGAHAFAGTSSIRVSEGSKEVESLSDTTTVVFDAKGNYHATLANSKDYGREVFFVDGTMYLRPRYGKYHRRAPASDGEPARVRDEIFGTLAANWELLYTRVELSDLGQVQVAGRPGKKIQIKAAPKDGARPAETLTQRAWRTSISVTAVAGEVVLDTETGVPLQAKLTGTIQFSRDGKNFEMSVEVTHAMTSIGDAAVVAAPPADQTVATQRRGHEPDDRQTLLKGIGPPAKRAPTPSNPTGTR